MRIHRHAVKQSVEGSASPTATTAPSLAAAVPAVYVVYYSLKAADGFKASLLRLLKVLNCSCWVCVH